MFFNNITVVLHTYMRIYFLRNAVFCICLAVFLLGTTVVDARDYDYGCPYRNPKLNVTEKELGKYIREMDFIFEGKPVKRGHAVVDMRVTVFEIQKLYKGDMPEDKKLWITHLKDMYEDQEETYFIRAKYADDQNLYPDPLACPKYYYDEEIVDHMRYLWSNFLIGFALLIFGVFVSLRFINKREALKKAEEAAAALDSPEDQV